MFWISLYGIPQNSLCIKLFRFRWPQILGRVCDMYILSTTNCVNRIHFLFFGHLYFYRYFIKKMNNPKSLKKISEITLFLIACRIFIWWKTSQCPLFNLLSLFFLKQSILFQRFLGNLNKRSLTILIHKKEKYFCGQVSFFYRYTKSILNKPHMILF